MKRLACVCVAALCGLATADMVVYQYDFEFSGATAPAGSGPWMTATFNRISSDTVELTLDNNGLVGTEFVRGWYFNVADGVLSKLVASFMSGQAAPSAPQMSQDTYKADGDGRYDILFNFGSSGGNRFTAGESSVWRFTTSDDSDLFASDFHFLSAPAGGHGPFYSAAHVQGIGRTGSDSGWVAPSGMTIVPSPGSALLGVLGLAGMTVIRRT